MTAFEGKVAFVTGASRGIGAAVALALADEGLKLGLASRSGDDLGLSARSHENATFAIRSRSTPLLQRRSRSSAGSTSLSPTPGSARTALSSSSTLISSRR
jgi:NAD(P)-dependent dehydrogenase (short-subunit alcohol dehydrogenase family)